MASLAGVGIDVVRGALIGTAEVVPGVSGGTIALIVGVYDRLIGSAAAVVRGTLSAVIDVPSGRGLARARGHFADVSWRVILPVLAGMATAVLVASALLAPAIESFPVETRAVFVGLILASLIVPIRMVGRWGAREVLLGALATVLAFVLTGLPAAGEAQPQLWFVAVAAAIAVCALVLPGVSGSFLLLAMGLYAPTLAAVNDRDLVYLGVFALGAVLGLGSFAPLLQWLLERRRQVTLAVMTGLMLGSLRALWPWQTEDGGVLAPVAEQLPLVIALVIAGAALVVALLVAESRLVRRHVASGPDVLAESSVSGPTE